jgi:hypothetical protein
MNDLVKCMVKQMPAHRQELFHCRTVPEFFLIAEATTGVDKLNDVFSAALNWLDPVPYWLFAYFLDRGALFHDTYLSDANKHFLLYLHYLHHYRGGDLSFLRRDVMADTWDYIFSGIDRHSLSQTHALLLHGYGSFLSAKTSAGIVARDAVVENQGLAILTSLQKRKVERDEFLAILVAFESNPIRYRNAYCALIEFAIATAALKLPVLIAIVIGEWLFAANDVYVAPLSLSTAWEVAKFIKNASCTASVDCKKAVQQRLAGARRKRAQRRDAARERHTPK